MIPVIPKLTTKQAKFCDEYLIDLNATQAAIRAGYSQKTADRIGPENLGKLGISTKITELMKVRDERTEYSAKQTLDNIDTIANTCLEDGLDLDRGVLKPLNERTAGFRVSLKKVKISRKIVTSLDSDGEIKADIIETVEVEMYDKLKANELAGRHRGLFPTKVEAKIEIEDTTKREAIKQMFEAMTQKQRDEWLAKELDR